MHLYRKGKRGGISRNRAQLALLCGGAGWVVSVTMIYWGGPLSRFIPRDGPQISAFLGATVAGYMVANGFGRAGLSGRALAALSACTATVLGAIIAGSILGGGQSYGAVDGAARGIVAITDGFSSVVVVATWALSMYGVDWFARRGRLIQNAPLKPLKNTDET